MAIDLIVQHIRDFLNDRGRVMIEPETPVVHTEGIRKRPHWTYSKYILNKFLKYV